MIINNKYLMEIYSCLMRYEIILLYNSACIIIIIPYPQVVAPSLFSQLQSVSWLFCSVLYFCLLCSSILVISTWASCTIIAVDVHGTSIATIIYNIANNQIIVRVNATVQSYQWSLINPLCIWLSLFSYWTLWVYTLSVLKSMHINIITEY